MTAGPTRSGTGSAHNATERDLERLSAYPHVVVSWVGDDGYPAQRCHHLRDRCGVRHRDPRRAGRAADPGRPRGRASSAATSTRSRASATTSAATCSSGARVQRGQPLHRRPSLGLGRDRDAVLRVLRAIGAAVAPLPRGPVRGEGAHDPAPPEPVLARAAHHAPAVPFCNRGAGAARHCRGRQPRRLHVVDGAADPHRWLIRASRHQRHQRRVRHPVGRR